MGATYSSPQNTEKEDTSWALSMAAAVPSGVIKIFEGTAEQTKKSKEVIEAYLGVDE